MAARIARPARQPGPGRPRSPCRPRPTAPGPARGRAPPRSPARTRAATRSRPGPGASCRAAAGGRGCRRRLTLAALVVALAAGVTAGVVIADGGHPAAQSPPRTQTHLPASPTVTASAKRPPRLARCRAGTGPQPGAPHRHLDRYLLLPAGLDRAPAGPQGGLERHPGRHLRLLPHRRRSWRAIRQLHADRELFRPGIPAQAGTLDQRAAELSHGQPHRPGAG